MRRTRPVQCLPPICRCVLCMFTLVPCQTDVPAAGRLGDGAMMLDLHKLNQFHVLATVGSYGRAALMLNVTQPSLTRSIQFLETQYGVSLLERSRGHSGIALTEAGRELHLRAGEILRLAIAAEQRLQQMHAPEMRLAFGMGPVLATMLLHGVEPDTDMLRQRTSVTIAPA